MIYLKYCAIGTVLLLLCAACSSQVESEPSSQAEASQSDRDRQDTRKVRYRVKLSSLRTSSSIPLRVAGMTAPERLIRAILPHKGKAENPKGSNRGPDVDPFTEPFGLEGYPWCAMGLSVICRSVDILFWTARAIDFLHQAQSGQVPARVWDVREIRRKQILPQPGWIPVKGRPGGNHVDVVLGSRIVNGQILVDVIGCNVGDAVTVRTMNISPGNRWGYTHFIEPL